MSFGRDRLEQEGARKVFDGDACCPWCDVEKSWIVGFLSDLMSEV